MEPVSNFKLSKECQHSFKTLTNLGGSYFLKYTEMAPFRQLTLAINLDREGSSDPLHTQDGVIYEWPISGKLLLFC